METIDSFIEFIKYCNKVNHTDLKDIMNNLDLTINSAIYFIQNQKTICTSIVFIGKNLDSDTINELANASLGNLELFIAKIYRTCCNNSITKHQIEEILQNKDFVAGVEWIRKNF